MSRLRAHLFPGDGDEHGAVIAAGVARSTRGPRLLARDLFLARDGVDYVPGRRGYRMLTAEFVRDHILYCRDQRLAYLAVHCHGGSNRVAFSPEDMASHVRGYPALLDIAQGQPVGALVLTPLAVAGDIWLPGGGRAELAEARMVGRKVDRLFPCPPLRPLRRAEDYDRQARLFGDRGQALLETVKVGVIGAGGAGSLLVEYLARLGVGWIVVVDPERMEVTNVPRVAGSTRRDAMTWLTSEGRVEWLRRLGLRLAAPKVRVAARVARVANPRVRIEPIRANLVDEAVARRLSDCDYLFLAADSAQARLVFNALVHQYLIPGVQVGAKVQVDKTTGDILDVFCVSRPVTPDSGCLWCNQLISPAKLQEESQTEEERRAQRYVDDPGVKAPSVITLNAIAAAHASNAFMFALTGLVKVEAESGYLFFHPRRRSFRLDQPRRDENCTECGQGGTSRLARGDAYELPTRAARPS